MNSAPKSCWAAQPGRAPRPRRLLTPSSREGRPTPCARSESWPGHSRRGDLASDPCQAPGAFFLRQGIRAHAGAWRGGESAHSLPLLRSVGAAAVEGGCRRNQRDSQRRRFADARSGPRAGRALAVFPVLMSPPAPRHVQRSRGARCRSARGPVLVGRKQALTAAPEGSPAQPASPWTQAASARPALRSTSRPPPARRRRTPAPG